MKDLPILFLPLAMAYIMFTLGLNLKLDNFRHIITYPKAFLVGAFNQLMLLPFIAFALVLLVQPRPEIAFGIMLLSICPGGITSNLFTQYARGNVALSISLTAAVSLLSTLSVPMLLAFFYRYFLSSNIGELNVLGLGIKLCLITLIPVSLGMMANAYQKQQIRRIRKATSLIANLAFAIIIFTTITTHWNALAQYFIKIGWLLMAMIAVLFSLATIISRWLKLNWLDTKTIAIESGFQNGAFAITLASLITNDTSTIPKFALPAVIYSILMNFIGAPFIIWFRAKS